MAPTAPSAASSPCHPGDRVPARTARCPVPGKATRRNAETRRRSHATCRASKGKPPMHRVLFICSRNRLRSPSAERLFANWPGVETDSAGLAADAETPLEREQLEWATLVVVMERRHRQALLRRHAAAMKASAWSAWISRTTTPTCRRNCCICWSARRGLSFGGTEWCGPRAEKRSRTKSGPRKGGPGVSPVRQGVRSAWAPARGCRTSGCGRCG